MNAPISYLSMEDIFWIDSKEHLLSFGYNKLPNDIHFTISFDKRNPEINFHITRNVSDRTKKPKITIASINKDLVNKLLEPLGKAILEQILFPLDIRFWRGKYGKELFFCSFIEMAKGEDNYKFEEWIERTFKENSIIKRKHRLKIKKSMEEEFTSAINRGKLRNIMLRNIKRFPRNYTEASDCGLLITKKISFLVIRINDTWYKLNDKITPIDLLNIAINDETTKDLINKFYESLEIIKTAQTYRDTEPYDVPISLVEL